jgi:hypothetical protein
MMSLWVSTGLWLLAISMSGWVKSIVAKKQHSASAGQRIEMIFMFSPSLFRLFKLTVLL